MGEPQGLQLQNLAQESAEEPKPSENAKKGSKQHKWWWIQMFIYSFFLLFGQSSATILGRLYYDKGGNSTWLATLVQTAGFPILIPFLFFFSTSKNQNQNQNQNQLSTPKQPSQLVLASIYIILGVIVAADCMLFSVGLLYLPVSTYSLLCATQLGFNAFFSYFLNSQKLTPFIINSLVLLTVSSTLLVFEPEPASSTKVSKGKYAIGFVCTVSASAMYALLMSLTQLVFKRVIRSESFVVVLKMIIYQSLVATVVIMLGLFASGEWKTLNGEMVSFQIGKLAYVMALVWTAITWAVFSIGAVGLIFQVSSLFSNVISTLGLPIVPLLALVIFHDKMSGVKAVSMVLAIWGFVSYIYQHYLDDLESKHASEDLHLVTEESMHERS